MEYFTDIYSKICGSIGIRPITFIIRDLWHEAEWLLQTIWFFLGVTAGIYWGWKVTLILWAVYSFGYINGHLFWGKKWIKGQEEIIERVVEK